jgi:hypothetical protein
MTAVFAFFSASFGGLVGFFVQWFTKKTALALSAIAAMVSITVVLYLSLKLLVIGIAASISNKWVLMGMTILWPSNADLCISVWFTAEIAIYLYYSQVRNIMFFFKD